MDCHWCRDWARSEEGSRREFGKTELSPEVALVAENPAGRSQNQVGMEQRRLTRSRPLAGLQGVVKARAAENTRAFHREGGTSMDGDLAEDMHAGGGEVAEPIGKRVRRTEMRRNGM
jgi:hypothetical protein